MSSNNMPKEFLKMLPSLYEIKKVRKKYFPFDIQQIYRSILFLDTKQIKNPLCNKKNEKSLEWL
jgi:hypothetical protein